jgi:hypothetical protein
MDTPERIALVEMHLDCEEQANAKGFSKAAMSSSVQQGQLPCARSDSFLDQKSSSSSTTA